MSVLSLNKPYVKINGNHCDSNIQDRPWMVFKEDQWSLYYKWLLDTDTQGSCEKSLNHKNKTNHKIFSYSDFCGPYNAGDLRQQIIN